MHLIFLISWFSFRSELLIILSLINILVEAHVYFTFSMQWKAKSISLILAFFYLSTSKRTNKKSLHSTNILKSQTCEFLQWQSKAPFFRSWCGKNTIFFAKVIINGNEFLLFFSLGTVVDSGVFAPVLTFQKLFEDEGVPITSDEVRAPMGVHKRVNTK